MVKILTEENELLTPDMLQYHVWNNLQLVYGMLSKQIETKYDIKEDDGIAAITRRVLTLAKVYEHLLDSVLTRTTDFGRYLSSLCDSYRDIGRAKHQEVALICQSQSLILDLETSTAVGLAVAELIANSYLHAFSENKGTIKISLNQDAEGNKAWINFADDGIGFQAQPRIGQNGLELVRRLMQQVKGSASVQSDHGTAWTLKFPLKPVPAQSPLASAH